MERQVFVCPHCFGKADKLSESKQFVKVKCRDCEDTFELDKIDL